MPVPTSGLNELTHVQLLEEVSGTGEGLRRISYDHYSEGSHLPLPEKVNLRAICSWQKGSASTASLRFPPAPRWSHAVLLPHLVSPHPDGHTPLQDPQSRGSSLGRRMPCSQKIPEEAKPGAFLQARLWASPSRRAEALGQHSGHCCQGELRKRQSTVQTGEDPRECCRGTSGGWHEWLGGWVLAPQKRPPTFLLGQVWVKVDCGSDLRHPAHRTAALRKLRPSGEPGPKGWARSLSTLPC